MKHPAIGALLGAAVTLVGVVGQADSGAASLSSRCGPALDQASQTAFRLYVHQQQAKGFSAAELVDGDAECQLRVKQQTPSAKENELHRTRFVLDADQCVALWAIWILPSEAGPAEKWHKATQIPAWFPPKTAIHPELTMPIAYNAAAFRERRADAGAAGVFNALPVALRARVEKLLERAVDVCLATEK